MTSPAATLERWISELGLDTLWHRAQAATG